MFIYFIIVITVTEENVAAINFAWGRNEEAVRMQISLHLSRKQMQSNFYIKEYRYNVYSQSGGNSENYKEEPHKRSYISWESGEGAYKEKAEEKVSLHF